MKQVERYHEKGYYVLYNPHSKRYLECLEKTHLGISASTTPNLFKALSFTTFKENAVDIIALAELEGFEWREIHVNYIQTLVTES